MWKRKSEEGEGLMSEMKWPYNIEFGQEECVESDILVLGGGIAGC